MDVLNCFMCEQRLAGGFNRLAQHFSEDHGITITRGIPNTGFICAQNGCNKNFVHFYNLRRHIKKTHIRERNNFPVADNIEMNQPQPLQNEGFVRMDDNVGAMYDDIGIQGHQNIIEADDENENVQEENVHFEFDLQSFIIKMVAKFHTHGSMTGSMITNILEDIEELMLNVHKSLKFQIDGQMRVGQVIDEAFISNIREILEFQNPCQGLKTYDQQINALIQNFGYVEPSEILLGRRIDTRLDKKTCTYLPRPVFETYQYVPIVDSLQLILSNKDIRQCIAEEQPSPHGMLGSFIDGQHFKNHAFFQKYKHAIRLRLYYDELEIVNPLGSKTGVHKLGAFYYQIGNLPVHLNSSVGSIHVLILCCHADVQKYGFEKILSPFLRDLCKLESDEGVSINFENENDTFVLRASLEGFCGDGLAVHEAFNLMGPSANKFCRLCLYDRNDLHSRSLEKVVQRTEQVYNEHLELLRRSNFSDATKTETGMKGDCCLNESKNFHVSRNKIFDIMHDLLCGICPMVVKLVLHTYVVKDSIFNSTYLNGVISLFNYGYYEHKNKPSANFTEAMLSKKDHTLSQKAMQMWCLVRALPFILAEKIDDGNEHMNLIIYLLRIMEIVFAPKINSTLLPYLDELIKEFMNYFSLLYPDVNFINKFHHLSHYSDCINWSGPLRHFYCMGFERKHNEIKRRAVNVHNFKNPSKTVIRISQCIDSLQWSGEFKINRLQIISGKTCKVHSVLSRQNLLHLGCADNDEVVCSKSVIINGVKYRKNVFVVLEKTMTRDDGLLLFGRIQEIIILENKVFLLTSICTTDFFDADVHAFSIRNIANADLRFVEALTLPYFKPLCCWTKAKSDALYISLRHIIL